MRQPQFGSAGTAVGIRVAEAFAHLIFEPSCSQRSLSFLSYFRTPNVIDNMLSMMEKYTNNLESIVNERTKQLELEKSKTNELLYKMLPK